MLHHATLETHLKSVKLFVAHLVVLTFLVWLMMWIPSYFSMILILVVVVFGGLVMGPIGGGLIGLFASLMHALRWGSYLYYYPGFLTGYLITCFTLPGIIGVIFGILSLKSNPNTVKSRNRVKATLYCSILAFFSSFAFYILFPVSYIFWTLFGVISWSLGLTVIFLFSFTWALLFDSLYRIGLQHLSFDIFRPDRAPLSLDTAVSSTSGGGRFSSMLSTRSVRAKVPKLDNTESVSSDTITITSGVDTAGENLKIAVKVTNDSDLTISAVTVTLDAPEALEYVKGSAATVRLGSIPPGKFQSAIYWLKAQRCIDDSYGGTVVYRDAKDVSYVVEIPRKDLVNICPMLEGTDSAKEIFTACKFGDMQKNNSAFKFAGPPQAVFSLATARLAALVPVEKMEEDSDKERYLAYACFVGQTKYSENRFAAEIQVSGYPSGGILTLSVYSDDPRILSGFFVDVMTEVRKHVEILEEQNQVRPTTCANCGAPLDLTNLGEKGLYECEACGSRGKIPPWML